MKYAKADNNDIIDSTMPENCLQGAFGVFLHMQMGIDYFERIFKAKKPKPIS